MIDIAIVAAVVSVVLLNLGFPKCSFKSHPASLPDCSETVKFLTYKWKSSSKSRPLGVSARARHTQVHAQHR